LAELQGIEAERTRQIGETFQRFQWQQKRVLALTVEEMLERDNQRLMRIGRIEKAHQRVGIKDPSVLLSIKKGDRARRDKEMKYLEDLIIGQDTVARRHLQRATSRLTSLLPPLESEDTGAEQAEAEARDRKNTAMERIKAKQDADAKSARERELINSECGRISLGRLVTHNYRDRIQECPV
jgi:hypothetical protein